MKNRSLWRIVSLRCLLLFALMILPGCGFSSWGVRHEWPSLFHRSARIPAEATKEEILETINAGTTPIQSWRATGAKVGVVTGLPALNAMIVVEEPNHIRMNVSRPLMGQSEFELGSNDENLWFWVREMKPQAVLTVGHNDLAQMQEQLPIPVQPEWLMEVLCIKPIDGTDADLIRDPENPYTVRLVSHYTNQAGHTVRKISTIDLRRGEIREHELYDADHRLIARARLTNYKEFPDTAARLPNNIELYWAQQDRTMDISLNGVEVNPPSLPDSLWAVPNIANCPVKQLKAEQLLAQPHHPAARTSQKDKPKAITEYALDQPSGAWMQEQYIEMPGKQDSAGRVMLSDRGPDESPHAESPAPAYSPESREGQNSAAGNSADSPYFRKGDFVGTIPASQSAENSSDSPPPFPAEFLKAKQPPQSVDDSPRKSRSDLIQY